MHRFCSLLVVTLMVSARAGSCGTGDVEASGQSPRAVAELGAPERLPPTKAAEASGGESPRLLRPTPTASGDVLSSREVSIVSYEEPIVDDYLPVEPTGPPVNPNSTRLFESTWYVRADYFYWGEQVGGATFMQNNGAVPTLGYQQRYRRQRFRAELFGGRVDYFAKVGGLDDFNVTDYLGLRGEYEVMFEPPTWQRLSFFAGIGTRFFVRSIPDIILENSLLVDGYQESWWTFYPYLGAESRRTMKTSGEAYWRARIGVTAFTREHVALNDVTLFPRANLTGQIEVGFRGPHWHVSSFSEAMAWSASPAVLMYDGQFLFKVRQPASQNVLIGFKTGFSY